MIELIGLHKCFRVDGHEIWALRDVSLSIKQGSIFGVIGPSGAGKSSLIRAINMLEPPTTGRVMVDGRDMTTLSRADLIEQRRSIGMIFQHFNLLTNKTVYENIALPLVLMGANKSAMDETVHPLIKLVGLLGRENSYPHQLSGGQKQRVAIARALATKPKVLLCDEATSALDQKTTTSILNLLQEINEKTGVTMVLITHELDVIKDICHEVALMDHGQIMEVSKVIEFFSAPKTKLGQDLVERSLNMQLPFNLQQELSLQKTKDKAKPLVRIVFRGHMVKEAIISQASRKFGVDISILHSNIEYIGKHTIGFLVAEILGEEASTAQVLEYFADKRLDFLVVGYVA